METNGVTNATSGATRGRLFAVAGCGCVGLIALAIGVTVALNWTFLSGAARSATETLAELQDVQAALMNRYGPAQVFVNSKRHTTVSGPILSVRIVNSASLSGLSAEAARLKALEVAAVSRDALKTQGSYENFEVILSRQVGAGVSVARNHAFMFKASELGPATEHRNRP